LATTPLAASVPFARSNSTSWMPLVVWLQYRSADVELNGTMTRSCSSTTVRAFGSQLAEDQV
jgi:hypothetical protein